MQIDVSFRRSEKTNPGKNAGFVSSSPRTKENTKEKSAQDQDYELSKVSSFIKM